MPSEYKIVFEQIAYEDALYQCFYAEPGGNAGEMAAV